MRDQQHKWNQRWYSDKPVGLFHRFLAKLFAAIYHSRRFLYHIKILKTHRFNKPVLVVGNITVGGGGKTPMVIYLAQQLMAQGLRVGVVSRGYGGQRKVEPMLVTPGADPAASGDEPLLMAKTLKIPVMVARKRAQAVKALIKQHNVDVVVSDDGLQHYAMSRDAEIVMLDNKRQIGNGLLLPAGPLREPAKRLDNVDLIVYKGQVEQGLYYQHEIAQIYQLIQPKNSRDVADFRSQKIIAMAGIARPDSFFSLLADNGLAVLKQPKPDHHVFQADDFSDEQMTLITEKDAVKCAGIKNPNIWVVKTRIVPTADTKDALTQLIDKVMS